MPLRSEPVSMPLKKVTFKKSPSGAIYVYLTIRAYRNKWGKPTSDEVAIGRKDIATGKLIPNRRYFELFQSEKGEHGSVQGNPVPNGVYSYGSIFTLMHIAQETGLRAVLEKRFPDKWEKLLSVAMYMVCEGNVMMYIQDWFDEFRIPISEPMDDQQCSRVFADISHDCRMRFFKEWVKLRSEQEYIAYDVTSISTHAKEIDIAEWGYSRDGESIPQVNLGMFYGAKSKLPIYYNLYSGSITDKSHLQFMMEGAESLGITKTRFVLDRGFVTEQNIKHMEAEGHRFVTALPQALFDTKRLIDRCNRSIHKTANRIGETGVYGMSKGIEMYASKLIAHIYYDPEKQVMDEKELYSHIERLERELSKMGKAKKATRRFTDYFQVESGSPGKFAYSQDEYKIDEKLSRAGFFVLLTNDHEISSAEALSIYRGRDTIEKAFDQFKNGLDFRRLKSHTGKTMDGKVFVGFLALILRSQLLKKVKECKATRQLTLEKILRELRKIKIWSFGGNKPEMLMPVTKMQREILESLGISTDMLKASCS